METALLILTFLVGMFVGAGAGVALIFYLGVRAQGKGGSKDGKD